MDSILRFPVTTLTCSIASDMVTEEVLLRRQSFATGSPQEMFNFIWGSEAPDILSNPTIYCWV